MASHLAARDFFGVFNAAFLIYLVVFGLVALIFIFYFNRLVAFVLFTLIRTYTWFFYRVHIKCQAFQFSLLGGRVFLRGLSYHGENETILVHQVHVTWQYWRRRVAHVNVKQQKEENENAESTSEQSDSSQCDSRKDNESCATTPRQDAKCRISVQVRGVEWFVYNRSPAYDAILASAARAVAEQHSEQEVGSIAEEKAPNMTESDIQDGNKVFRASAQVIPVSTQSNVPLQKAQPPIFLKLLPIAVDCNKAAMVMGNQHTRSVLVAKVDHANGKINAHPSGPLDIYRQAFEFDLSNTVVQFIPNQDYTEPLLSAGARLNGVNETLHSQEEEGKDPSRHRKSRHKFRHALGRMLPQFRRSVQSFDGKPSSSHRDEAVSPLDVSLSGISRWIGLSRYLDEEEEDQLEHDRWQGIEYGEDHTIADFSTLHMNFYWDTPGIVGALNKHFKAGAAAAQSGDINGSDPPEWSLEIRLGRGVVQYGPWADRQRVDFMTVFFPAAYMDSVPALPLRAGQTRMSTVFKILIVLDDQVQLRLLTREPSKDWKFKGLGQDGVNASKSKDKSRQQRGGKRIKTAFDPHDRPAGWLNITVAANTTVRYDMDMVPRKSGFKNELNVDVVSLEVQTSVNQDALLRSSAMNVSADISNPLGWNTSRTWLFEISFKDTDLFFLREHAFLIQDLVEDFTLGPPPGFYTFIPFVYDLRLDFNTLRIFLNSNELNIIDNASDLDGNTFIVLETDRVVAQVDIPAEKLNPIQNKIGFSGLLENSKLRILTPSWNTYHSLFEAEAIGKFPLIEAKGYYNYYTESSPSHTDTLVMSIHGNAPEMLLYGFLIRYFLNFQENYFGKDVHFQTLEEYQSRLEKPGRNHAADNERKPTKQSSDLDVILSITTANPSIMLPSTLYTNTSLVKLDLEDGHADLRFTNYYMDLQTSLSPISISHHVPPSHNTIERNPDDLGIQTFINGATITGHRLFGLPPTEPTYACNWDFQVGDINGESCIEFLGALASGIQSFIYALDDKENALPGQEEQSLNDVTFIRASIKPICLWVLADQAAFLCELAESKVEFNDWSRQRFSQRLFMEIPNIVLAVVDRSSALRSNSNSGDPVTHGYLQTSVDFRMVQSKANFREERRRQQEHLRLHDIRTNRTPWLIRDAAFLSASNAQPLLAKLHPPASQFPPIPDPLEGGRKGSSASLVTKSTGSTESSRKANSFLHLDSLKSRSVENLGHVNEKPSHLDTLRKKAGQHLPLTDRTEAHFEKNAMNTSSYGRPHFLFSNVKPSSHDLPDIKSTEMGVRGRSRSGVDVEDFPLDDDDIVHLSFMISLKSGLRVTCTPPALEWTSQLLATVLSRRPDALLDSVHVRSLEEEIALRQPDKPPQSVQIRLELPGAAIRFRHQSREQSSINQVQQIYQVALQNLTVLGRLGAHRPPPLGKTPSSLHLSLARIELEASRSIEESAYDAQVVAKLSALACWAHDAEEVTGELQFRALEIASLNRKTEHLAALVNDAGSLTNNLANSFTSATSTHKARLQFMVYKLLAVGDKVADPPILTGASFISRSSGGHVRASDSWKMMMRLRWILRGMDQKAANNLAVECSGNDFKLPEDLPSQVASAFRNWRGWDLSNLQSCSLMNDLFGKAPSQDSSGQGAPKPARIAFNSGIIILAIDPAVKGNKVILDGLAFAVVSSIDVASDPSNSGSLEVSVSRKTTIEMMCERFLVEVRIELLDAVRGIFSHVKTLEASQEIPHHATAKVEDEIPTTQEIHCIAFVKRSDFRLRTQNLKTTFRSDNFRASVLGGQSSVAETTFTGIITTQTCSTFLRSSSRRLMKVSLDQPTFFVNYKLKKVESHTRNSWDIGGSCHSITFDVFENILGLIAVTDQFIHEEIVYIMGTAREMQSSSTAVSEPTTAPDLPTIDTFRVVLELGIYKITVPIFSSLFYRLEGSGARGSLVPGTARQNSYRLDIDLREHSHAVLNNEGNASWEVARLVLPPINGKLGHRRSDEVSIVGVDFHISPIRIDASAIHGLFSAFSRNEATKFGKDVTRDMSIVKANYETISAAFSSSDSDNDNSKPFIKSQDSLRYSAQVNVDGVTVLAHSSKSLKTSAELLIDSGPIGFSIGNEQKETGVIIPFPDLNLRLNTIKVVLESLQDGERIPCGKVTFAFSVTGGSEISEERLVRTFNAVIDRLSVDIYTETASMIIDILGYLQQRFKRFNLKEEIHTFRAQRRRRARSHVKASELGSQITEVDENDDIPVALFDAIVTFQLRQLQLAWRVADLEAKAPTSEPEDLIFSIDAISLKTKKGKTARLEIKNLQLQLVPQSQLATTRSNNSALLPEVVFRVAYLSTSKERRLAFQALGKALDLRLTSQFILPLSNVQKSIAVATQDLRTVLADWNETLVKGDSEQTSVLGSKKLSSLVVDADFDGAVVFMEGRDISDRMRGKGSHTSRHGRLGQYEDRNKTTLTSPGLAFKIEYKDTVPTGRFLNAEVKVAASHNKLQPMFVPLILEVVSSVKDLVGQASEAQKTVEQKAVESLSKEGAENIPDPSAILGDCKLNLGFRICEQSFTLTCEPIAKVTATGKFDDIYVTVSTVQPTDGQRFFAVSSAITGLETTVRHVYSREPTGRFDVKSVNLSMMNSEHVSGMKGISSILNISPMTVILNVKQLQDFLTFREIWYPVEIRPAPQAPAQSTDQTIGGVQRYYQATATNSFSWNAAINIANLDLQLDLGQSVGRLSFSISKLWVSSRKDSEQEQNLCLGFESIGAQSKGRVSGSVEMRNLRLRTNIVWLDKPAVNRTPLVQASLRFADLRAKAAFDYQTFAVADFQSLGFLLYNTSQTGFDRLLCTVDGDKIHAYCTANVAAQSVALYQAIDRLIQEKLATFEVSLKQMEKFQRQKAAAGLGLSVSQELSQSVISGNDTELTPIQLQVNVVVSLNALKVGVYPRAFTDNQIFKLEALDALARFGVNINDGFTHTLLTVVLGQLRVAVSSVNRDQRPKMLGEVSVEDVVKDSVASRGGTILKVPRVVATMQTWQPLGTRHVEYIFRSTFEGKVEVGWNYARISSIRAMWDTHSKALEQRLGKPLPQSAVQITSSPRPDMGMFAEEGGEVKSVEGSDKQPKELITAVVNVPVSKYTYRARQPPVIQTPQLRDMGEATPPLEWIGLQRDKLPNLTHQVVIVPLLEFAKEVEDAYSKILGAK